MNLFIKTVAWLLFCQPLLMPGMAQGPQIKLLKKEYDFGKVANVQYTAAGFEFMNTGDAPLAIIMVHCGPGVKVNFPRRFIEPGEHNYIYVLPQGNDLGSFKEEVQLYTNADEKPQVITVSGERISVLNCFPVPSDLTVRIVHVLNKLTREPLPGAQVSLVHNFSKQIELKTGREGKVNASLKIGMYTAKVSKPGFAELADSFFLVKSQPEIYFELEPLVIAPAQVENLPVPAAVPVDTGLLPVSRYASNNLVFLLDVSLSMREQGKIDLLKQSLVYLISALRPIDQVSLVTYAAEPSVLMVAVNGQQKKALDRQIGKIIPEGTTNGLKGLESAFDIALNNFIPGGNNQVIIATDGLFSESNRAEQQLFDLIAKYAGKGIRLSVVGFGINESARARMQKMAEASHGSYIQVDENKGEFTFLLEEIRAGSLLH